MVLPGHLAGGYLATRALLSVARPALSAGQLTALTIIGTLSGEAPDSDLILFYFEHRSQKKTKTESHRDYPSHAPLLWLCGSLGVVIVGIITGQLFVQFLGWTILVGSWSHFVLDSIEHGIRWLWPFSNRYWGLREMPAGPAPTARPGTLSYYAWQLSNSYTKSWSVYLEIFITVVAIAVALHY